ncbi:hypothetical protein KP509_21G046200 [Ceratopteris richardii]|nr:hypothetical protein KP509_21G046200 [Ceratopteris richardii]
MISSHAKSSQGRKALEIYHEMCQQGFQPNLVTYLGVLRACTNIKDPMHGMVMHSHIVKSGLESEIAVGSTLVDMYGKCGKMEMAYSVFKKLENRNIVSWAAMIAGCAHCGQGLMAFQLFSEMNKKRINPDRVMFLCMLKACCSLAAVVPGLVIHSHIVELELEGNVTLGSSLIDLYAKCGCLHEAENVFTRIPEPNVVAWSTIINAYVDHQQEGLAIECFRSMQRAGIEPGRVAFLAVLKASGNIGSIIQGRLVHDHVIKVTKHMDLIIGNSLIDMYCKCGSLIEARTVFDSLKYRDLVTYGVMIAGYAQNEHAHIAIELFERMFQEGIKPDRAVLLAAIKACAVGNALDEGKLIHYELVGSKFEADLIVGTALAEMYITCGYLMEGWTIFKLLPSHDNVIWSTILMGLVKHKQSHLVFQHFKDMTENGLQLDVPLLLCILKASTDMRMILEGRLLHKQIVICGFHSDVAVRSSLIDLYAKCGYLEDAQNVFDESIEQNVVSWGAMISGYVQYGQGFVALDLYSRMQHEDLKPEDATFTSALLACSSVGALDQGKIIHMHILQSRSQSDLIIQNTLVDLYMKCNRPQEAQATFDRLQSPDVVSWSALIGGYALIGDFKSMRQCLYLMCQGGLSPDKILYMTMLSAFSHVGLAEDGQVCVQALTRDFRFWPCLQHSNCILDLLGRSGSLKEGTTFLQAMPISPNSLSLTSLLTSCRIYGHIMRARHCFEHPTEAW